VWERERKREVGRLAVTFLATISMLTSAIQIAGDGGARLKLDIDDTGMDAVMALSAMRGEVLVVTVQTEAEAAKISSQSEDGKSDRNRRAKSRRTRTQSEGAATQ